jgi:hypothetical protein
MDDTMMDTSENLDDGLVGQLKDTLGETFAAQIAGTYDARWAKAILGTANTLQES